MPPTDDELSCLLTGFLAGEERSRSELVPLLMPWMKARAKRLAPHDFPRRGLIDDVVNHAWELLLRKAPDAFDPGRGSAKAYVAGVLRTSVRDIRDENKAVVSRSRDYTVPAPAAMDAHRPGVRRIVIDLQDDPGFTEVEDFDWLVSVQPTGVLGTAVATIAMSDATMVSVASDSGLSRFALKRQLTSWAKAELAGAVA